jgi:hypothetical protein
VRILKVNATMFNPKRVAATRTSMRMEVLSGFHPKGAASVKASVVHELGHCMDEEITRVFGSTWTSKTDALYQPFKKLSPSAQREALSEYASKEYKRLGALPQTEFLAEAWSEYICNPKPRPIAVKVGKLMEMGIEQLVEMYGRYGL